MKNRWIATLVLLALALAALLPAAAIAEPIVLSMTMGIDETYQIKTSAITGAEGKQLMFATSNKKVVSVSADGLITAHRTGTAKIAVGYDDTALAVCTVKVLGKPNSLSMSRKNLVLNVGETGQLTARLPKKTGSIITYESSDPAVATVSADGNVTAVAAGHAVVTAKTYNDKTAGCAVMVLAGKAPATLDAGIEALPLQVKESFKLAPVVEDGAEAVFAYSSSNKRIATVNADGVITAKKRGKAKITVMAHNGLTATVNVTVSAKRTNLYSALTDKPKTFLKTVKKLKMRRGSADNSAESVMYYNSQAALIMTANSCQVTLIPANKPKYSILGLDGSMSVELATMKLLNNGWMLVGTKNVDGVDVRAYAREGDLTHLIAISAEGSALRSIDAFWLWNSDAE